MLYCQPQIDSRKKNCLNITPSIGKERHGGVGGAASFCMMEQTPLKAVKSPLFYKAHPDLRLEKKNLNRPLSL